jgi:hypothetical protein
VNLGSAINSGSDDGIPQISADNRTLVFASSRALRLGQLEVWMSARTNALVPWEPAHHLAAPINHVGDTFPTEISRDGLLLFLKSWRPIASSPDAPEIGAIYLCRRLSHDQPFGPPVLIQPILGIGTGGADACSLSDDGTTLYVGTYRVLYPDWAQLLQIDVNQIPQLSAPKTIASGQFQFELTGREGANYEIQFSSDLKTWNSLLITNASSSVQLLDPAPAPGGRHFYRALSH